MADIPGSGGFMAGLVSDKRGNTLALMAAALIPFCGMVGGGIDLSRMYITKTRLQHACDAGALAGRKQMGAGVWGTDDNDAAVQYFDANFAPGSYGSTGLTKSFAEAAGKVTGTASASLPMTLMRVLGKTTETLAVSCDAEMRLPNTDIMFVLDTTGSMEDKAVNTDTQTKIAALRSAVKCFFEIVARLDTNEICATGAPSGGVGSQVQVRFGFVPYATNVNVGRLLPTAWFADSWKYQSREAQWANTTTYTYPAYSDTGSSTTNSPGSWSAYQDDSATNVQTSGPPTCVAPAQTSSSTSSSSDSAVTQNGNTRSYTTTTTTTTTSRRYTSSGANTVYNGTRYYYCQVRVSTKTDTSTTTVTRTSQGVPTTTRRFTQWRYAQIPVNISGLKNGSLWNTNFQLPIGNTASGATAATMKTIGWDGCIEERATARQTTYTSSTGGTPKDLDIDTVPSAGDADSLWGPALNDVIFARGSTANDLSDNDVPGFNRAELIDNNNYATIDGNNLDSYFCPAEARKLQQWPLASGFESYVDGLSTGGNTYHDIGLLWGARFLSPNGIFTSENAYTPAGGEIDRNLIFMTDGETCTASYNYGPYGLPWYDRRQTADATVPTYGCETETSTGGMLSEQVNARYAAICTAVKNKNITLWVIWFGVSRPNLETRLMSCATPNRFYAARNAAALQTTFASIANQISQLRLTR